MDWAGIKYTAVMKRRKRSMRGVVNNIVRLNILDENKNLVARLRQLPVAGVNSFTLKNRQKQRQPSWCL